MTHELSLHRLLDNIERLEYTLPRRDDFASNKDTTSQAITLTGPNWYNEKKRKLDITAPRLARTPHPLTDKMETTARNCTCRSNPRSRPTHTSMVVNLSGIPLSDAELSLLSKWLSFCPTLPKPDAFKMEMDLEDVYRR